MNRHRLAFLSNLIKAVTVLVPIAAFLLGGGFLWQQVIHVPKLAYSVLASYDVETWSFSGLVVENEGLDTSHRVLIKVTDLESPIQALKVTSDEAVTTSAGEGQTEVILELDRMAAGSQVTLYILTTDPVTLNSHVTVTSDEGKGVPLSEASDWLRPVWIVLAVAVITLLVSTIIGGLWAINRFRRWESERELQHKAKKAQLLRAERARMYTDLIKLLRTVDWDEQTKQEFIRAAFGTTSGMQLKGDTDPRTRS